MLKHLYKHLSKFDKFFLLFLLILSVANIYFSNWLALGFNIFFALFILLLAGKDMTIKHLQDLIELQFDLLDKMMKATGGSKIVKTETIEFSLEKVSKAKKGKKANEKPSNEDSSNAGRTRGGASKKPTAPKGANPKGTGANGVSNRKPKASKKNSKA